MNRLCAAAAALVLAFAPTPGRSQAPLEFEVASVKAVDNSTLGPAISMNIGTVRGAEVTFGNATLNDCVRFAYGMASDALIMVPAWVKSKQYLYDVIAKGPAGASNTDLQAMMRALLAERFKMTTHRERKEMSYYALVAAGSSKMRPVNEVPDDFHGTAYPGRVDNILQMSKLAYFLSRFETERPIIDETGLDGMYEVKLEWTARQLQNPDPEVPGISLFTALQEQLGLRLEARKGPVDILVVDSAEKIPTEN